MSFNFDFNFRDFIKSQPQPHKQTPKRLAWLYWFTTGLNSIYNEFKTFVNEKRTDMAVDGSTLSIEWYLDEKTGVTGHILQPGSSLPQIYLYNFEEGRQPLYEGGYIYNLEEFAQDSDFIIDTPTTGRQAEIKAYVDQYKLAGLRFTINEI